MNYKIIDTEYFENFDPTVHITIKYNNKNYLCAFQIDENDILIHASTLGYSSDQFFDLSEKLNKVQFEKLENNLFEIAKKIFEINLDL